MHPCSNVAGKCSKFCFQMYPAAQVSLMTMCNSMWAAFVRTRRCAGRFASYALIDFCGSSCDESYEGITGSLKPNNTSPSGTKKAPPPIPTALPRAPTCVQRRKSRVSTHEACFSSSLLCNAKGVVCFWRAFQPIASLQTTKVVLQICPWR